MPLDYYLASVLDWTQSLGGWGLIVVAALYVLACLLFLPGSILTLGVGFLFGAPAGVLTVLTGANFGACAVFVVGRTIARDWIARKIADNPKLAALDVAVGKEGFRMVLLLRLNPVVPFNVLNYALGLTKVSFRDYALATLIGMLPETLILVYLGSAAKSLADSVTGQADSGTAGRVFMWIGLAATIGVAILATRIAQRSLKAARTPARDARMATPVEGLREKEVNNRTIPVWACRTFPIPSRGFEPTIPQFIGEQPANPLDSRIEHSSFSDFMRSTQPSTHLSDER
ncbi:MAG: TVP38/TMEM64 family protein [Desulfomonilaceae bacterium]